MADKTQPREYPILFSGEMVRAILAGRKIVTRRVMKRQPHAAHLGYMMTGPGVATLCGPDYPDGDSDDIACPYGQPGDRLWVRETWLELDRDHWHEPGKPRDAWVQRKHLVRNSIAYRADTDADGDAIRREYGYKWRPSIFMPRWASRLTLENAGVSVERVQDIHMSDVADEGYPGHVDRSSFVALWDQLNAKRGAGWEANPWVWVVRFKLLEVRA